MSTTPDPSGTPADDDTGQTDPPSDESQLGDAGKRALAAERRRAREAEAAVRAADERARQAEEETQRLQEAAMSDQDRAVQAARTEAAAEARREAEAAANDRIVAANRRLTAAVAHGQALAAGVRPDRVEPFLRLVDTTTVNVTDDGTVDEAAVRQLIEDELALLPEFKTGPAKPATGNGTSGGFDGGARGTPTKGGLDAGRERARKRFGLDKHAS